MFLKVYIRRWGSKAYNSRKFQGKIVSYTRITQIYLIRLHKKSKITLTSLFKAYRKVNVFPIFLNILGWYAFYS